MTTTPKTRTIPGTATNYTDALPLDAILPDPDNERGEPKNLEDLADSIKTHGLLEPIRVYALNKNAQPAYRLTSGHRRLAAAQLAGLLTLPAFITPPPATELQKHTERLIANVQREDLTETQKARGYKAIMQADPTLTQTKLAAHLGISQSAIANALRLLQLPTDVITLLDAGMISSGHGIELLRIDSPTLDHKGQETETRAEAQHRLAQRTATEELTVRDLRELIKDRSRTNSTGHQYQAEELRRAKEQAQREAGTFIDTQAEKRTAKQEQERAESITRQKRRDLAAAAIKKVVAIDPKTGPTLDQLKFAAHWINSQGSWQRPNIKEITKDIDFASNPKQVLTIITEITLSYIHCDNNGSDLQPAPYGQEHTFEFAAKTWPIKAAINEAINATETE